MAIREAVRFNGDRFARNAFGGKSTAIDRRKNRINDGAHPPLSDSGSAVRRGRKGYVFFGWRFALGASHELPSAARGSIGVAN